jgi:small GTP-binding protein
MAILSDQQNDLRKHERDLLSRLQLALVKFGASQADIDTLGQSIRQLDELFLLVVVGEFNSGKSAFINALLGQRLLQEGVTPTTAQINIIRHGNQLERSVVDENLHILNLPVESLREISIVDTPGTNAIIRAHEVLTSQFVPRSDLVLFITSADRPFTESERGFLERIRDWGKKVVVIVNKVDIFQNEEELEQVRKFISENARSLLGMTPEIFLVSARKAMQAKMTGEDSPSSAGGGLWEQSRFAELEKFIYDTLDEESRIRLKLLSPLGVGSHLLDGTLAIIENRLDLLKADFTMLDDVDAQLSLYQEDMKRDFNFRMADIENILFEMEQRGDEFFEDTFRLARIFDLLSKERIQNEFAQKVVGDTSQRIDRKVGELIDWLVDADLRQWQAVNEHLAERRKQHQERIVGDTARDNFHYDRERLIDAVGREAQRVVETFDRDAEAQEIAEGAQTAVAASAAIEIGAVGLGTLVTILATTLAADVTGILLASAIAAIGLFVIPARRRTAKMEMHRKVTELREKLTRSLKQQFEREIDRSMQNITNAIAPYTRFVRSEREKMTETRQDLEEIRAEIEVLKGKIE